MEGTLVRDYRHHVGGHPSLAVSPSPIPTLRCNTVEDFNKEATIYFWQKSQQVQLVHVCLAVSGNVRKVDVFEPEILMLQIFTYMYKYTKIHAEMAMTAFAIKIQKGFIYEGTKARKLWAKDRPISNLRSGVRAKVN